MRIKKLLALLLSVLLLLSCFTLTTQAANTGKIKNVIYLIPDGGGMVPFNLSDAVKQAGGMNTSLYPYVTPQTVNKMYLKDYLIAGMTTSALGTTGPTDSAAAGTAMATGHKTGLYQIGLDANLKPMANILEAAQLSGRKTGLVSIYEFPHATPAAFSAHAMDRTNYRMMAEQIVNQGIDVVLAPGLYNNSCKYTDALDVVTGMGYTLINSKYELANIKKGDRVWSNMPTYAFDHQNTVASPTLAEMTAAAIRALECNEGFFMMVEGSSVDTGGHDNNAIEMVGNFIAFDEACKVAIEYAKGRNDTVVIAAPDHDTGGMNIVNQSLAVTNIRNGVNPGTNALTWSAKDHTARNGGVFLYVPSGISYPSGASSNPGVSSNFNNYVIDNDDLAPYLADCMGFNLDAATSELFVNVSSMGTYTKTLDPASGSYNFTGTFRFNNANCTVEANQSYATLNGERVSLDGQVAFYEYYTGKFYVPQKLLNFINGTEIPDPDASTGGASGGSGLITQSSIESMGTAATFWGNVSTYENLTPNGNESFTIQPGGWATFNVPVTSSGIYYLQVRSGGGNTSLEMLVDDTYFAEMTVGTTTQDYSLNGGNYEFLYMPAGKIHVKLTNTGTQACTVSEIKLMASQLAVNAGVTPTMSDVKVRVPWQYAAQHQVDYYNGYTSGGTCTSQLAPGAYTTVNVSGFPYTGIYALQLKLSALSGTAKVRVTTGDGYYADYAITEVNTWTNRMVPPQDQAIYLKSGSNTLYIENTGTTSFTMAEYDFGRMDKGNTMNFKYLLKYTDTLPNGSPTPTSTSSGTTSGPTTGVPELPATTFSSWAGSYKTVNTDYSTSYWPNGTKTYIDSSRIPGHNTANVMTVGKSVTYTVNAPYTGVYAFQTYTGDYSGGNPIFDISTPEGYYCIVNRTATGWSTGDRTDGLLFLRQGNNTITVTMTGGCTQAGLYDIDIGLFIESGTYSSMAFYPAVSYRGSVVDPTATPTATPTPTPTPSSTPTPTPTAIPSGSTISYNNAPYAGVYQVTSDKATTLTNETGHTVTLTAGGTGYFYLIKGANTITSTNNSATLTFTTLADNGMDHYAQINAGTAPLTSSHIYLGPTSDSDTTNNIGTYVVSGSGSYTQYGQVYQMSTGATLTLEATVAQAGLYYLSPQLNDSNTYTIRIETDTGHYGEYIKSSGQWGWDHFYQANTSDLELVYLRAGTNTFTITNKGSGVANLRSLRLSQTAELTTYPQYVNQLNVENCKVIAGTELPASPTPTPTPTSPSSGTTISYNNAPYAGVYQVTSDKATTLTNETGHTVTLTAGGTGYFYLIKGTNNITKSNSSANITFTTLANNGESLISSVAVSSVPLAADRYYFGSDDGIGQYVISKDSNVTVSGDDDYISIPAGATVTTRVTVPQSAIYGICLQLNDSGSNLIYVETNTGYYGEIQQYRWGWNESHNGATASDFEFAYLRAGDNTYTITNRGTSTAILAAYRASKTAGVEAYGGQQNYNNCKVVINNEITPTVTDKFAAKSPVTLTHTLSTLSSGISVSLGDLFSAVGPEIDSPGVTVTVAGANVNKVASDWTQSTITFTTAGTYTVTITDNDYCNDATTTVTVNNPTNVTKFTGKTISRQQAYGENTVTVTLGDLFTKGSYDINNSGITVTGGDLGSGSTWSTRTVTITGTGKKTITITDNYYCNTATATVNISAPANVDKFTAKNPTIRHTLANMDAGNVTTTLGNIFTGNSQVTGTVTYQIGSAAAQTVAASSWSTKSVTIPGGVTTVTVTIHDSYCCNTATASVKLTAPANVTKWNATNKTINLTLSSYGTAQNVNFSELFTAKSGAYIKDANIAVTVNNGGSYADGVITVPGTAGTYTATVTDNYYCTATTATITVNDPTDVTKFTGKTISRQQAYGENTVTVTLGDLFTKGSYDINNSGITVTGGDLGSGSTWSTRTVTITGTGAKTITINDGYFCNNASATVNVSAPNPIDKFTAKNPTIQHTLATMDAGSVTTTLGNIFTGSENVTGTVTYKIGSAAAQTVAAASWASQSVTIPGGATTVTVTITDNYYCNTESATVTLTAPSAVTKWNAANKNINLTLGTYGTAQDVAFSELFTAKSGAYIKSGNIAVSVNNGGSYAGGVITVPGAAGTYTATVTDNYYCTPTTATITVVNPSTVDKFIGSHTDAEITTDGGNVTLTLAELFSAAGPVINSQDVTVTVSGATVDKVASDWTATTITFPAAGDYTITVTDGFFCNEATATVSVTQLVSGFSGLTVSGNTATVSYTKTNSENKSAMLILAAYNGNQLVDINLTDVDTTAQAVGTTQTYTVSLSGAAGTLKAMLFDSNLVPQLTPAP